jgi:hypothetical protein
VEPVEFALGVVADVPSSVVPQAEAFRRSAYAKGRDFMCRTSCETYVR